MGKYELKQLKTSISKHNVGKKERNMIESDIDKNEVKLFFSTSYERVN